MNSIIHALVFNGVLQVGLIGSRSLHDRMITSILAAPMRFFDTTPVGRILNRCSRDIESLDQSLPSQLLDLCLLAAMLAMNMLIVCIVAPPFLIALVPAMYGFLRIQVRWR